MIRGAAAAATDAAAEAAARATLESGGAACDALVAGFFAAAGASPGVLLAPAIALVAGTGAGTRAFDGRALQPGRGAPRPRGLLAGAPVPPAASVGVPRGPAMLALIHSYFGRARWSALTVAGAQAATEAGAKARASLLRAIGASGPLALVAEDVTSPLVAAGGAVAGGMLTAEDLSAERPAEAAAQVVASGEGATIVTSPWTDEEHVASQAILAVDARGVVAALAYEPVKGGVDVPALELTIGGRAEPVRRGVTRLAPGTPLALGAPIALVLRAGGYACACAAPAAIAHAADFEELASGPVLEAAFEVLRARRAGAIAVAGDGRAARRL